MSKKRDKLQVVKEEAPDLTDPLELLDLLKDAILRKPFERDAVAQDLKKALRATLSSYEEQNRLFLVAAANAELPRILNLLTFIRSCEGEMFKEQRIAAATNRELIRMYALAQTNLLSSLDNVRKVADMRLEAVKALGGADGISKMLDLEGNAIDALTELPALDAPSRERVRGLIEGLSDIVIDDDSVTVDQDEYTESPEDAEDD